MAIPSALESPFGLRTQAAEKWGPSLGAPTPSQQTDITPVSQVVAGTLAWKKPYQFYVLS